MRRFWPAVLAIAVVGPSASARDAAAGKPYDLQVFLKVGAHRLLTPTYRQQLAEELRDGLQSAFGALADVRVLDVDADPKAKAAWLDPVAADGSHQLGPAKRHFVAIDFAGGQYTIRTRQHDGATGLASPLIRQARTADRRFVGRQVLRFIHEDFGAVGTVARIEGSRVWLDLKGGAVASADVARWAPAGSLFAVVRVRSDGAAAEPVEATYLRAVAAPTNGQIECELISRWSNAMRFWPQDAHRAIRLGTARAPVRLRVTDPNGLPQAGLLVRVSGTGFKPTDEIKAQGTVRDGFFETTEPFDGLACVRVSAGEQPVALVPVPILDDRVVEIRVPSAAAEEARDEIEADARREQRALHDILRRVKEQNRQLGSLLKETKNREALERLQTSLEQLDQERARHSTEVTRLREAGRKTTADVGEILEDCDRILKDIRQVSLRLLDIESKLKADQAVAASPEAQEKRDTVSALMRKVELHLEAAEYEEGIETYKQILAQTGEREDIRKKLDDLEAAWKTKGPEHEEARRFAYAVWAKVANFEDVRAKLALAREKFEACKTHRDKLTVRKLFLVATDQATKILLDAVEDVKKSDSDVVPLLTKQIEKARDDLTALIKDMQAFLEG